MLVVVVMVVLILLCFFTLCKNGNKQAKTDKAEAVATVTAPKIYRYCTDCYRPCRPKDMVCRDCGKVLRPDLLEKYNATPKKIRYCSVCYKPCEPGAVVCEDCGYVLRPEAFEPEVAEA